jgi:uncharacterized protein (TIGR03118 family)
MKSMFMIATALSIVSDAQAQVYKTPEPRELTGPRWIQPELLPRKDSRNAYVMVPLVSTRESDQPLIVDANLVDAWGISLRPPGKGGHWWITNAGTGTTTTYIGDAPGHPFGRDELEVVDLPVGALHEKNETYSQPTGTVYSGFAATEFAVDDGKIKASSKFIFVALDGTVYGWANGQEKGVKVIDRGAQGRMYTGLAISERASGNRIYACCMNTASVDVFDGDWKPVTMAGNFKDPKIDEGYAIFNLWWHDGRIYAAWARVANEPGDAEPYPGYGFLSVFDEEGRLLRSLEHTMQLNAPWGFAIAPKDFGALSNHLLVGNFGDGRILAYNMETGTYVDTLRDQKGDPIELDGLWGLAWGNGETLGYSNHLYFAAGPEQETQGLFGKLVPLFP